MPSKEKKLPEKRDESAGSEMMHRLKTHPFLFIGTIVVLLIVIVAFVFVPAIVPNAQRGQELVFGYYNKIPIKYTRDNYFYQVQQYLARNQNPSSDDPNYVFIVRQIWRQAYEEAAVHIGILDEVKRAGYIAPEAVVDRNVAELPQFQENGRFSSARYNSMDSNSRMSLWRQVQESLQASNYVMDMTGLKTSSREASFISAMASPRRNFDLAAFPFSSYPDSEIVAYSAANPALFRVTHLSRITIGAGEREAHQVLDSVKSGETTFEEAARLNSQDSYADKGGDMGIRMAYELLYETGDEQSREAVVNLARGGISDIIKVPSGWAFFRAEETAHPADINDPAQREKIQNYVMIYARGQVEDWLVAEAEKFAAQARTAGFDEAAAVANIDKRSFGPLPVNYGNSALFSTVSSAGIPEIANAGTNEFFWKAAFSTPLNTPSHPLVIGDNVIVLFPLEESAAEENETEMVEMYYPYWAGSGTEQAFRMHFLTNEKFDDRFEELFWKLWGPGY